MTARTTGTIAPTHWRAWHDLPHLRNAVGRLATAQAWALSPLPDLAQARMTDLNPFYGVKDERQDAFDATFPLPDAGQNELLDSLLERKRLRPGDLVRTGARWDPGEPHVLQFWWPDGVRYRDLITDRRWVDPTSDFTLPKIIVGTHRARCVVVEGETDAARLSGPDGPGYDVLVMGGATPKQTWVEAWLASLNDYDLVLVATDADAAGDKAARVLTKALGVKAVRWRPPDGQDWCSLERIPATPEPPKPLPTWVRGEELFDLEWPEVPSYLENALLPTTGQLAIHGWKSSYKSWLAWDLALQLAVGGRWAGFETTEPNLRVGIVQFEVPPFYYMERMRMLMDAVPADDRQYLRDVWHFSPMVLPSWNAANEKHMDAFVTEALEHELEVLVFDPIRQMVGTASMNDEEVQQYLVQLFRTLNRHGVAVVFTHHDSKSAARSRGGSPLDMTAGQVLAGAADSIVSVQLPKGDDIDTSRRRNLRFVVRGAPGITPRGFTMEDNGPAYHESGFYDDSETDDEVGLS